MWSNPHFPVDLVIFTEEIFNEFVFCTVWKCSFGTIADIKCQQLSIILFSGLPKYERKNSEAWILENWDWKLRHFQREGILYYI